MRPVIAFVLAFASWQWACGQIKYSKAYPVGRRTVPLSILNCDKNWFYLLRYNKLAHDLTIERRRKSDGSIAAFTPLKLDSVNAHWFYYEELEYIWFRKHEKLYFLFEKEMKNERVLFMKVIDTLGKSSGFIELSKIEALKEEDVLVMDFWTDAAKNVFITKARQYGETKRWQYEKINPAKPGEKFHTRLPLENHGTGYSRLHIVAPDGHLVYLRAGYNLAIFDNPMPGFQAPRYFFAADSLWLVRFNPVNGNTQVTHVNASNVEIMDLPEPEIDARGDIALHMLTTVADEKDEEKYEFVSFLFDSLLQEKHFSMTPFDESLAKQLTFYDGKDDNSPAAKNYNRFRSFSHDSSCVHFSSRYSENFYKEMIVWKCNHDGSLAKQAIVPRKTFFFPDRTNYKLLGTPMQTYVDGSVYTLLLEHRSNQKIGPEAFYFHRFRRIESQRSANMVAYVLRNGGVLEKKVVYENKEYSCIPLHYESDQTDMVLYFVRNELERYGVIELNQL